MFYILISLFLLGKISSSIIIPFQTYNPLLTKNNSLLELIKKSSDKSIVDTMLRNLIYTNLIISDNNLELPTFFEMSSENIAIIDISISERQKSIKIRNSNFTFADNYLLKPIFKIKYYSSSKSKSYKFVEDCYDYIFDFLSIKNQCGNETVFLTKKNNIKEKEQINPINIYIKFKEVVDYDHRPGIIGLSYNNDFISELKERKEISKYDFSFKYTNPTEDKGELIIGDLPHIYDKDNYNEENLRSTKIILEGSVKWSINFDIYITLKNQSQKEKHLAIDNIAAFYIEEFFITGSHIYMKYIEENFFKKYIELKLCKRKTHNKAYYSETFFHFLCDIDNEQIRKEFFDEFPVLILSQKEMNYNFSLTAEDLFTIIPDGKRIIFNVDFILNSNKWIIGKPFFKKYQLIFNFDSNLISYYINPKDIQINKEEENYKRGNGLKIFIIIFLIFLAFVVGIILGRVLCIKYNRKMRANELEDNFSYDTNDSNNEESKDNLTKINFQNNDNNCKSKYYQLY